MAATSKQDLSKKTKYKRTYKVTWGGRPYKSKKQHSFAKSMENVKVVDGVLVLNKQDTKTTKTASLISKKENILAYASENENMEIMTNQELGFSNNQIKKSLSQKFSSLQDFQNSNNNKVDLSPMSTLRANDYEFINEEHNNNNSPFAPFTGIISGIGDINVTGSFLESNSNLDNPAELMMIADNDMIEPNDESNDNINFLDESVSHLSDNNKDYSDFYFIKPSLKTSFDFVQFFIHHSGTMFTPVSVNGYLYRNSNPFSTILPSLAFRDSLTFKIMEEFAKIAIATSTLKKNRLISTNYSTVSSTDSFAFSDSLSNKSIIQDMNFEDYVSVNSNSDDELDFIEEKIVLQRSRDTYKELEIRSIKFAAEILSQYQSSKFVFDYKIINSGIANLLLLLVHNSYFGKHNKNVNLILGFCRKLLSIYNQDDSDSTITIESEHLQKQENEFDTERFFTSSTVSKVIQPTFERETRFLANWTNYNDLLTSMTILPETNLIKNKETLVYSNYKYRVDNSDHRMCDFKDIEYFSGVDIQMMKYINELTSLLAIKNDPKSFYVKQDFMDQCQKLSEKIELYISQTERERDFMIYESKNNKHWSRTESEIKEYQQLRTVNKIFALISILQVQRRLLGKLTNDEKVRSILFELIILLDEKVLKASAQAQCLFGSIFIIGCELGNLFNDSDSHKSWSAILNKGKHIVLAHFDALDNNGLMAAERAKEIVHHIWMTNSLNTTYKDWWVILKENKINIHLSL
ncbi:hypothetical protein QEN19_003953 [Hanseniaspora menglaensis]